MDFQQLRIASDTAHSTGKRIAKHLQTFIVRIIHRKENLQGISALVRDDIENKQSN
jgi:hypothetical protein